ncbi:MAG: non-canonical purine NTP pyrophosphatase [Candidatus Kerfeldbacteria bacterium]|nr:non-canonical purine NTP pyrophosphatase [Candidatus Kerfeldbacteria bacterium]
MTKLLIATKNPAKFKNFVRLLAGYNLDIVSLSDLGVVADVTETGTTFEENAKLKAQAYFDLTGLPTLVDDSGLAIDALGGWPGLYSRRVWGPQEREATDEEARAEVLKRMEGVPDDKRAAHFMVAVALAMPNGEVHTAQFRADGVIARAPRGQLEPGYPYRTIFYHPQFGKTSAELEVEGNHDNYLNHRKNAIMKLDNYLKQLEGHAQ